MTDAARRPEPPRGSYHREGSGLEFDRVSFFSDAVYAIAMTLLVVELHVPEGADPVTLLDALRDERDAIVSFFVGFVVIGRYWLAHHQFFAALRSIDQPMISVNLLYLAFVAFTPFPLGLISRYSDSPISFLIFATTMVMVSGLEVVLFLMAVRRNHTQRPLSPRVTHFALIAAGSPVLLMLASMPLALLSPRLALLSWLLMFPLGWLTHRHAPREIEAYQRPNDLTP